MKIKGRVLPVPKHNAMKTYVGVDVEIHGFFYMSTSWG
jgi:hypothetical protein